MIIIARKFKQVHRKEIVYDLKEWAEIERRAAECHTDTSKYIKYKSLHDDAVFYDMKEVAPLLNGLRIISNNVNQVAKKANETNNIYAEDVDKLKAEVSELCHTSPKTHSYKTHANTSFYPPATNYPFKNKT